MTYDGPIETSNKEKSLTCQSQIWSSHVGSRSGIVEMKARLVGVDVPRSLPTSQKGAKAVVKVFGLPCMIKESTGGAGVGLVKLSADVERYFLRFGHLYYWKRKIRQFLLRRAGALVAPANELYELQSVAPGDTAAYTAVAAAGQLLAGVAYAGRFTRGAVPLETWRDVDLTAGRAKLMENVVQISGFVSFDFMMTEHSVVLIECNCLIGTPFRNDGVGGIRHVRILIERVFGEGAHAIDLPALRTLWRTTFRSSPPPAFSKDILARFSTN